MLYKFCFQDCDSCNGKFTLINATEWCDSWRPPPLPPPGNAAEVYNSALQDLMRNSKYSIKENLLHYAGEELDDKMYTVIYACL